jgi:hypothetical protein
MVREIRRGDDGTFDDIQPIIYPVGQAPEVAFIGHFDDRPGLDLLTVNFASRDLTYFAAPSFTDAPGQGRSIPFGDHQVVAALMSELRPDGKNDLALADEGQGITFVVSTPTGPVIGPTVNVPNVSRPTDLVQGSNPNTFYVIGAGQTAMAQMDWPAASAETSPATPAAATSRPSEPMPEATEASAPEASLFSLSASGVEIAASATIPGTLNSVTLLATLARRLEDMRPEFEVGAEELDRFYSQPLVDFTESDDALFRFASGQREMLERARGAGELSPHDTALPGQPAPSSTPVPANVPEGPVPSWIGEISARELEVSAASSTPNDCASARERGSRHLDSDRSQAEVSALPESQARARSAPLADLAFGIVLPWEDHWRKREASFLLAIALAASTCRRRHPDDERTANHLA